MRGAAVLFLFIALLSGCTEAGGEHCPVYVTVERHEAGDELHFVVEEAHGSDFRFEDLTLELREPSGDSSLRANLTDLANGSGPQGLELDDASPTGRLGKGDIISSGDDRWHEMVVFERAKAVGGTTRCH